MSLPENNTLFNKIGLAKESSFELAIDEEILRDFFYSNVSDKKNFGGYSSHSKIFHGKIKSFSFVLSYPTYYFNGSVPAMTKGNFKQGDSGIKIEMLTYVPVDLVFFGFSIIFTIAIVFNYLVITKGAPWFIIILFDSFYVFFGLRFYFLSRRAVALLSSTIEKEFRRWAELNSNH